MERRNFLRGIAGVIPVSVGLPKTSGLQSETETAPSAVEKIWRLELREMDRLLLRQQDYPLYFLPVEIEMFSRDASPKRRSFRPLGLKDGQGRMVGCHSFGCPRHV